jgi:UDP-N-acetylglucosamine 2-epimerase (non-hydrolysing)
MKPIYLVAGARPNFIKLAPLVRALQEQRALHAQGGPPFEIVHTGQHYDPLMSEAFFEALEIPTPQHALEVGSAPINPQTARLIERFDALLVERPPAAVVVFGDVTSTLACALAAARYQIPVAHVEAGLRSFDPAMPEELNRRLTDALASLLFVSEPAGVANLRREGAPEAAIHLVGNIMIDTLVQMRPQALARQTHENYGLPSGGYALLTLHRPSNVDDPQVLARLLGLFAELSGELPIIFPVHPRTRGRIADLELRISDLANSQSEIRNSKFSLVDPVDYLDSLCLQANARLVLTDSGGMQEETSFLGVPCLTLRNNTERPVTVELGTSTLVGNEPNRIRAAWREALEGRYKRGGEIPLWDGQAAGRIAERLLRFSDLI